MCRESYTGILRSQFFTIISHCIPRPSARTVEHYVIFFCDDCDRLEPAIAAFKKVQPGLVVHTTSQVQDLMAKIKKHRPELLLLYFHDISKSYVEVLKEVRGTAEASNIPVLVYHDLPGGAELEKAFSEFRKKT